MDPVQQQLRGMSADIHAIKQKLNRPSPERAAGFTPGSVLFGGSNGIPEEDNATLFWNNTNKRLIIGGNTNGNGNAKLILRGTNASVNGPHLETLTALDNHPLVQLLSFTHDNINLSFDAYYDGGWKSSDAGSNFQIRKQSDVFGIYYDSGVTAGAAVSWNQALQVATTGNITALAALAAVGTISTNETVTVSKTDAATDGLITGLTIQHLSTGNPNAFVNIGSIITFNAHTNSSGTAVNRGQSQIVSDWLSISDSSRRARQRFILYDSVGGRTALTLASSGSASEIGFFTTTTAGRQTVTGSRGGNAALASLLTALAAYNLIVNSSTA